MSLAMPVVWSDSCRLHDPGGEIWIGVRTEGTEVAARVDAVRDSLVRNGARIVEAEGHPDESLLRVHDDSLLSYLASAWEEWTAAGLPEDPGQDRVVPYVFAHASLTSGRPPHIPAATWAKPGYFAYDTMTLIGPGTWEAARAAVDVALTAVDLVLGGEPTAYGCCRPPGHHAARACYGGSCYLNNAAIAAAELVERIGGAGCRARHRRASRQRHAGALLRPGRRRRRLRARRSRCRLVPALSRLRRRDWRWCRRRSEREHSARAGVGRRRVAGCRRPTFRACSLARGASRRGPAGRRRGRRRSRKPAARHRCRLSRGGTPDRRTGTCPPCSCRKAATT